MNALETHSLTKRYGRKTAVDALALAVPEGSICAFLGPNGAGKTTTIQLLMNLLRADAGEAFVLGVPATHLSPREWAQIGYVSENQELPEGMNVAEFLAFCRPLYPTWDGDFEARLLKQFNLPLDRKLRHLSRGMKMKAALLSSLAYRPRLVVLDEPFSGLDPLVRDEFIRGLLELAGEGGWTLFISSHDIDEVERLADRVAILDEGTLRVNETAESLQARFRKVVINLPRAVPPIATPPPGWLHMETSGAHLQFIATDFKPGALEAEVRERLGAQAELTATPMTLREIYLAHARTFAMKEGK
ncbi:MAG: ABC transporter ATP-binding protein [Verrucomicrobia bacterium]|nr:ABC transporter ATP-binding protein [Verrucomicrobiota bacterium]